MRSLLTSSGAHLEGFQNIAHQGLGKVPREPLDSRRIFFDKAGEIGGGFKLFMENVVGVLIENALVTVGHQHVHVDGDQEAGGDAGLLSWLDGRWSRFYRSTAARIRR